MSIFAQLAAIIPSRIPADEDSATQLVFGGAPQHESSQCPVDLVCRTALIARSV